MFLTVFVYKAIGHNKAEQVGEVFINPQMVESCRVFKGEFDVADAKTLFEVRMSSNWTFLVNDQGWKMIQQSHKDVDSSRDGL